MPSASRIEALSGSRRFAFSSATVACAAMPARRWRRPRWKRLYVDSLMTRLSDPATRRGRCVNRRGPRERPEREQPAGSLPPGEAAASLLEDGPQLALRREGRGRRALGRAEPRSRRRRHERLCADPELPFHDLAELAERRAARRLDALVDEERGELLPAGGGDAARVTAGGSDHARAGLGEHDGPHGCGKSG